MPEPPLHIVHSVGALEHLARAGVPGEMHAWREAMLCGPCRGGLGRDERLDERAVYLAETHGGHPLETRLALGRQESLLDRAAAGREVVLWFEDDLGCQVHTWYLLARLGDRVERLSLVGGPERLSEGEPGDPIRRFGERRALGADARATGATAWRAYASPDPRAIERLVARGTLPGLPSAAAALRLHLERFPDRRSGLGRIERRALAYAASGSDRFGDLFRHFLGDEPDYGLVAAEMLWHLEDLARGPRPLVALAGLTRGPDRTAPALLRRIRIAATDDGRAVLEGDADFVALAGADSWLGGVRLQGRSVWRWDPDAARLVAP